MLYKKTGLDLSERLPEGQHKDNIIEMIRKDKESKITNN